MGDLDDDELKATRKLNGVDDGLFDESDKNVASIEKDIKILEDENQVVFDYQTRTFDERWKKAYKNIIDFAKKALEVEKKNSFLTFGRLGVLNEAEIEKIIISVMEKNYVHKQKILETMQKLEKEAEEDGDEWGCKACRIALLVNLLKGES